MEIIIGKNAGFCYGVKRAVDGSEAEILNQKENIYCLGELVHNKQVIEGLEEKGLKFIENINEVTDKNSTLIIRSHGATNKVYELAKQKEIELIDYTCPNVLRIHKLAEKYKQEGYYIFLVVVEAHPETIGTRSYCGENCSLISNEDNIESAIKELEKTQIKKLSILVQTTYSVHKFENIVKIIKDRIKENIQIVVENTICLTSEQRQKETEELSKKVDSMIIIGGKNSSNTKKLYEVAEKNCKNTILIETKEELEKEKLNKSKKIGIMAGASTPQKSINDVIKFLKYE